MEDWIYVTQLHKEICNQITKAIVELEKQGHLVGYPLSITYVKRDKKEYTLPMEYDQEIIRIKIP